MFTSTLLMSLWAITSAVGGPPAMAEIPDDVTACITSRHMWVAAPQYFERFTFTDDEGKQTPAIQILDHHDGRDGHLLVFPETCRIVVLIAAPTKRPLVDEMTFAGGMAATDAEARTLRKWARLRPVDGQDVRHAPTAAVLALEKGLPSALLRVRLPWLAGTISRSEMKPSGRVYAGAPPSSFERALTTTEGTTMTVVRNDRIDPTPVDDGTSRPTFIRPGLSSSTMQVHRVHDDETIAVVIFREADGGRGPGFQVGHVLLGVDVTTSHNTGRFLILRRAVGENARPEFIVVDSGNRSAYVLSSRVGTFENARATDDGILVADGSLLPWSALIPSAKLPPVRKDTPVP